MLRIAQRAGVCSSLGASPPGKTPRRSPAGPSGCDEPRAAVDGLVFPRSTRATAVLARLLRGRWDVLAGLVLAVRLKVTHTVALVFEPERRALPAALLAVIRHGLRHDSNPVAWLRHVHIDGDGVASDRVAVIGFQT